MIKKLLIFIMINAVIAGIVAFAPMSLIAGREFDRQTVVWDYVAETQAGTPINAIFGDSRPECCIAARELGFVNLSLSGSTPVEGYYQLRDMLERGLRVESLILSYGPFHIFSQDTYHSRTRYFGLIDSGYVEQVNASIEEFDDAEYLDYHWSAMDTIGRTMPFLSDQLKFRVINIVSIHKVLAWGFVRIRDSLFPPPDNERGLADPRFKLHEPTSIDWVNVGTAPPEYDDPHAKSAVNELFLGRLIDLANEHGIRLHFLVMPMNEDVLQPDDGYFERFEHLIGKFGLGECYSGIQWWPNDHFWDPSHLNNRGVARFHEMLPDLLTFCDSVGHRAGH